MVGLLAAPLLMTCSTQTKTQLQRVQERGELIVVTRNAATTYYESHDSAAGIEFDLMRGFADELGVGLRVIPADTVGEVLRRLEGREADLAAAGVVITEQRLHHFRFSEPYQRVSRQVVYRLGADRPTDFASMHGRMEVAAGSSHAELLSTVALNNSDLTWTETSTVDDEELFAMVYDRMVDYTMALSHEVALMRRFYPELQVAFDVGAPLDLAWGFSRDEDTSLLEAANRYFDRARKDGTLAQLIERYYGHVEQFDYVGTRTFLRHIQDRLPAYHQDFEQAAQENGIDWRLLAAMGYQESHWDPDAISPTGVRGLMMLTRATAQDLGVSRREDPKQSIAGGALYLRRLLNAIPEEVPEPDRTYLALTAYNLGYGHLEDARVLTEKQGGNPNRWSEVKESLPLLHQKKWYNQTRHGYARGKEALSYVENIRSYYDILVWLDEKNQRTTTPLQIAMPTL